MLQKALKLFSFEGKKMKSLTVLFEVDQIEQDNSYGKLKLSYC